MRQLQSKSYQADALCLQMVLLKHGEEMPYEDLKPIKPLSGNASSGNLKMPALKLIFLKTGQKKHSHNNRKLHDDLIKVAGRKKGQLK